MDDGLEDGPGALDHRCEHLPVRVEPKRLAEVIEVALQEIIGSADARQEREMPLRGE
jgi:hypothetical protein